MVAIYIQTTLQSVSNPTCHVTIILTAVHPEAVMESKQWGQYDALSFLFAVRLGVDGPSDILWGKKRPYSLSLHTPIPHPTALIRGPLPSSRNCRVKPIRDLVCISQCKYTGVLCGYLYNTLVAFISALIVHLFHHVCPCPGLWGKRRSCGCSLDVSSWDSRTPHWLDMKTHTDRTPFWALPLISCPASFTPPLSPFLCAMFWWSGIIFTSVLKSRHG